MQDSHRASVRWAAWAALILSLCAATAPAEEADGPASLVMATTTSVRDSGLLDALLPDLERRLGLQLRVVAVGSGAALRMGAEGNADLLLTHAPAAEKELVASEAALSRTPFMENYFVITGPPEDPAHVREATSPEEAFRRIAAAGAPYVSRADDSGTHRRERELLAAAGLDPDGGWAGFAKTGAGMGITLQVAGERRAYALSDIGTFLAFERHTKLAVLSKPADSLRNEYSLLRISPQRFPQVRGEAARRVEAFFLEPDVQQAIADFGRERFGRPLFRPLLLEGTAPSGAGDAPQGADAP